MDADGKQDGGGGGVGASVNGSGFGHVMGGGGGGGGGDGCVVVVVVVVVVEVVVVVLNGIVKHPAQHECLALSQGLPQLSHVSLTEVRLQQTVFAK